jgi:hypothetical protein
MNGAYRAANSWIVRAKGQKYAFNHKISAIYSLVN